MPAAIVTREEVSGGVSHTAHQPAPVTETLDLERLPLALGREFNQCGRLAVKGEHCARENWTHARDLTTIDSVR